MTDGTEFGAALEKLKAAVLDFERIAERIGYKPTAPAPSALTPRQREVLRLVAEGHNPAYIAKTLGVTANTARSHIQACLSNLKCSSQARAVAIAIRKGLL